MRTHHPCLPLLDSLRAVIIGKEPTLRLVLAALLSGGHVLLEDVPGVGKTLLARSIAQLLGGAARRVQFSPDLMPSDITGVNVYHPPTGEFRFVPGPLFAQVLLADEINRASPRTQASLLEAMEERQATIDGVTHALPKPFLVIATQNPLDHQGTFPLPEAQLDRFAIAVSLGYPSPLEEQRLLTRAIGAEPEGPLAPVTTPEALAGWQAEVRAVRVDAALTAYMVEVVQRTRAHAGLAIGVSPRGALTWLRLAQAVAWLDGRDYVVPDDLRDTAEACLAHRVLPARARQSAERRGLIAEVLAGVAVPV